MNFYDLMCSHVKWKVRLNVLVHDPNGAKLSSDALRRDDVCELGKWIYGEGLQYRDTAAYQNLLKKHADFHIMCAEVVKQLNAGDKAGAEAALGNPFDLASNEIFNALMALKDEATKDRQEVPGLGGGD